MSGATVPTPAARDPWEVTAPPRRVLAWPTSVPIAPLLLTGVLLGPTGLAVLTPRVLAAMDPAIPVALTALGALLGLERTAGRGANTFRVAGLALGAVTMLVVGAGLGVVNAVWPSMVSPSWLLPTACGVCAASTLALAGRPLDQPRRQPDALVAWEATFTVLAGAVLIAALRPGGSVLALLEGIGIAVVLAVAGWSLVMHTTSTTERRVFAVATLLLVGGAADLIAMSALLAGVIAGTLWHHLGDPSRDALHREVQYVHQPFLVLVLLAAGAHAEWSTMTIGLGGTYASLRAVARFAAGTGVRRFAWATPTDLGLQLVTPGTFGVAIALNLLRVAGGDTAGVTTVLSVVVIGTVLSDGVARVAAARRGGS